MLGRVGKCVCSDEVALIRLALRGGVRGSEKHITGKGSAVGGNGHVLFTVNHDLQRVLHEIGRVDIVGTALGLDGVGVLGLDTTECPPSCLIAGAISNCRSGNSATIGAVRRTLI